MIWSKSNCLSLKVQNVATNKTMSLFLSCAQTFFVCSFLLIESAQCIVLITFKTACLQWKNKAFITCKNKTMILCLWLLYISSVQCSIKFNNRLFLIQNTWTGFSRNQHLFIKMIFFAGDALHCDSCDHTAESVPVPGTPASVCEGPNIADNLLITWSASTDHCLTTFTTSIATTTGISELWKHYFFKLFT